MFLFFYMAGFVAWTHLKSMHFDFIFLFKNFFSEFNEINKLFVLSGLCMSAMAADSKE